MNGCLRRYRTHWLCCATCLAVPFVTWGLDAHLGPGFIDDPNQITVQVSGERFERDITQEIAFDGGTFNAEQTENRLFARVEVPLAPRWRVHAVTGFTDGQDATNLAPLIGGGTSYAFAPWRGIHPSLFLSILYIDDIEYRRPGALTPIAEIAATERSESYIEYGGGFQLAVPWSPRPFLQVIPYGGLTVSQLDADGEETFTLSTVNRSRTDDAVDFEEDGVLNTVLGAALVFKENFGIRAEWRAVNQSSYSAGLFFSF